MSKTSSLYAASSKFAQAADPELASPQVSIQPIDSYIQKAVQMLQATNGSYFVGVRRIVVDTAHGDAFGYVESGPNKDHSIIHVNLPKIKSSVQQRGLQGAEYEQALVRAIAQVIAHEKGHITSFNPQHGGFVGGESPAEQEERSIEPKLK